MTKVDPRFFTSSILRVPERLLLKGGVWRRVPLRVRIGYFHHPVLGHTLIDTGYGAALTRPTKRQSLLLRLYRALLRPDTLTDWPIAAGLGRLGLRTGDIQTVLLSHLHADHISGLAEVPQARVLCSRQAWEAMQGQSPVANAKEGVFAELLPQDLPSRLSFFEDAPVGPAPLGLGQAHDIVGDGSVLIVDLPGHLTGHVGLCFAKLPTPLLYATDAQWLLPAILQDRCPGPPAKLIFHNWTAAMQSVGRIRAFADAGGDVMLCHDPQVRDRDLDGEVGP